MKEIKLAQELIRDANKFFDPETMPVPSMLLDKATNQNLKLDVLKSELETQGFTIVDLDNAPEPYSNFPEPFKKQKWVIYKL